MSEDRKVCCQDGKCIRCIHYKVCLLHRKTAEVNAKVGYIIFPNDLAKSCSEYEENFIEKLKACYEALLKEDSYEPIRSLIREYEEA